MKFPRNARIFRGQLDAAPLAAVFFLLVIFMMLSTLVYTPGVPLRLPVADDLPGTDKPTVSVAIDASGRLYFQNQLVEQGRLKEQLKRAGGESAAPLVMIIQADKAVSYDQLVQLTMLARECGIHEAWLATLPRPFSTSKAVSAK